MDQQVATTFLIEDAKDKYNCPTKIEKNSYNHNSTYTRNEILIQ